MKTENRDMKRLGVYRSYLLYEVEGEEGRDISTSNKRAKILVLRGADFRHPILSAKEY